MPDHPLSCLSLLIIADDLSGAADCAIPCVAAGLETWVALDETALPPVTTRVLALDADTRRLPPERAAMRVSTLLQHVHQSACLWFKKFDSTLRGNVGAELAAALRVRRQTAPQSLALVAPAFPSMGRYTRDGQQYLNDIPVEQTEAWQHDRLSGRAHVPTLLEEAGLRVASIGLELIRAPSGALQMTLARQQGLYDAVVCDAETEDDLRRITQAGLSLGTPLVWGGSAGLARHLPAEAGLRGNVTSASASGCATGPLLFVVGSMSSISQSQVKRLLPTIQALHVKLSPALLRAGETTPAWHETRQTLLRAVTNGQDVVIQLEQEGLPNGAEGLQLCQSLARLVAPLSSLLGGVFATGGETARAVFTSFGITSLHLRGEVEPGVPLAHAAISQNGSRPLPVITKAGAFGQPETLVRCAQILRAPESFCIQKGKIS